MRAGKLRHRVTVQQLVAGSPQQLANGEPDTAWTSYVTVWASVEPVTGREPFLAQAHLAEVTYKVRMRYQAGITEKMRLSMSGVVYDIRAVLDWEMKHAELLLLVSEGLNNG